MGPCTGVKRGLDEREGGGQQLDLQSIKEAAAAEAHRVLEMFVLKLARAESTIAQQHNDLVELKREVCSWRSRRLEPARCLHDPAPTCPTFARPPYSPSFSVIPVSSRLPTSHSSPDPLPSLMHPIYPPTLPYPSCVRSRTPFQPPTPPSSDMRAPNHAPPITGAEEKAPS